MMGEGENIKGTLSKKQKKHFVEITVKNIYDGSLCQKSFLQCNWLDLTLPLHQTTLQSVLSDPNTSEIPLSPTFHPLTLLQHPPQALWFIGKTHQNSTGSFDKALQTYFWSSFGICQSDFWRSMCDSQNNWVSTDSKKSSFKSLNVLSNLINWNFSNRCLYLWIIKLRHFIFFLR